MYAKAIFSPFWPGPRIRPKWSQKYEGRHYRFLTTPHQVTLLERHFLRFAGARSAGPAKRSEKVFTGRPFLTQNRPQGRAKRVLGRFWGKIGAKGRESAFCAILPQKGLPVNTFSSRKHHLIKDEGWPSRVTAVFFRPFFKVFQT